MSDPEKASTNIAASDGAESTVIEDRDVQQAMRKMSDKAPETVMDITAMMGTMSGHPLHRKMNEGHITKVLDLAAQHDTNEFTLRTQQQEHIRERCKNELIAHLIIFTIFIGLIVTILLTFKNQPTILVPLLSGIGGIVTGFLGGVGYSKAKTPPKEADDE